MASNNNHNRVFHEFLRVEENNMSMLVCLKSYQYQIKKKNDKTKAEVFKLEDEKQQKQYLKRKLIAAYQRQAKNKKLQSELNLWDSISGDGL